MKTLCWLSVVALLLPTAALSQERPGDAERGSTPPGASRDGSRPSDGAIQGGAILPGETAGMPDANRTRMRCEELAGSLREDCLRQQRDAASGSSKDPGRETLPSPPHTAPPQNPR